MGMYGTRLQLFRHLQAIIGRLLRRRQVARLVERVELQVQDDLRARIG